MVKCTLCGVEIPPGTGLMYVKKDSKIFHFCSRKCEKNLIQLKRKPNTTKWSSHLTKRTVKKKK